MKDKDIPILSEPTALPGYDVLPGAYQSKNLLCPRPPKTDFQASWIWAPSDSRSDWRNSYVHFRRRFRAQGPVTIDITAEHYYDLFLDGRRIDRGTAPSVVEYKTFDTHTLNLESGWHVIAVLVHYLGETCATAMKSQPGLLVELTSARGTKIITDAAWKTLPSSAYQHDLPCMMSHFGFYEVCDYRRAPADWTSVDFDHAQWSSAQIVASAHSSPWHRLIPRDIPLLDHHPIEARTVIGRGHYRPAAVIPQAQHQTIAVEMAARQRVTYPQSSGSLPVVLGRTDRDEFAVIDFGREVTGHVQLVFLPSAGGQQIDIGYDETLSPTGVPDPRRTYVHFADHYVLRNGQTSLEVFNPRGFRYLLLDVSSNRGGLTLTRVVLHERTYPVKRRGFFKCSHPQLDSLYHIGFNSLRLNMLDSYVDCPSRERVMWMDAYVQGIFSCYATGDTRLWRRSLFLFAQNASQKPGFIGAVKGFAPCDYDPVNLTYMMYYVCWVADYFTFTDDLDACAALWKTVMDQFDVIGAFTMPNGLIGDQWPRGDLFLDWSAMDYGGLSSSVNAIYIRMHQKTAALAEALDQPEVARELRQKAQHLTAVFRELFYDAKDGLFADALYDGRASAVRSQLANALTVWAGIVPPDEARGMIQRITDEKTLLPRTSGDYRLQSDFQCQTGGIVQIGTPVMGYLLAHVMFSLGLDEQAIDYVEKNWSHLGVNGTFAEHFEWDDNTSFCHGWAAGPVALWPRFILGVEPLTPGWQTIAIRPQPGELKWAQGCIPLPQGDLLVSWIRKGDKLNVDFELPKGVALAQPAGHSTTRKGKFTAEIAPNTPGPD